MKNNARTVILLSVLLAPAFGYVAHAAEIDISGATVEIISPDQFMLRGVLMEDHLYWGQLKWNSGYNVFVVERFGLVNGLGENFNDGVADNWIDDGTGRWEVANGLYSMHGSQLGFAFSYYDRDFTDITFEFDMMREAGDPNYRSMALLVRSSNVLNPDIEGYRFSMIPIGWWGVGKYVNGEYNIIISSENNYSPAINTGLGAWNHLKVECRGQEFSYSINGVHLTTVTDSDFSSGALALAFYEYGEEVNHVDNVIIQAPLPRDPDTGASPPVRDDMPFDEETGCPRQTVR